MEDQAEPDPRLRRGMGVRNWSLQQRPDASGFPRASLYRHLWRQQHASDSSPKGRMAARDWLCLEPRKKWEDGHPRRGRLVLGDELYLPKIAPPDPPPPPPTTPNHPSFHPTSP